MEVSGQLHATATSAFGERAHIAHCVGPRDNLDTLEKERFLAFEEK
jgi:hypothetical protein